jgi:hypothetical protein
MSQKKTENGVNSREIIRLCQEEENQTLKGKNGT